MAEHRVELEFPHGLELGNKDVTIAVHSGGKKLGELGLSKGDVTWWPRNWQNGRSITWERLAELLTEEVQ